MPVSAFGAAIVRVLPLGVIVMLFPADNATLSDKPFRLRTTAPAAIFAPVTAPFASWVVLIPPALTPSGEPAVPSPVSDGSCITLAIPALAKSTMETVVYGKLPLTEPVKRDEKLILPVPILAAAMNATSRLSVSPYENGFDRPL